MLTYAHRRKVITDHEKNPDTRKTVQTREKRDAVADVLTVKVRNFVPLLFWLFLFFAVAG